MSNPIDIFPNQEVPEEWRMNVMKSHRNRLLQESDWSMMPDVVTDKEAWAAYRQALRDFPATWVPSEQANFPNKPEV